MTRFEHNTPVELFGENVLLADITADMTVRSEAEALTLADENGWDDIDLIAKACALSLSVTQDGESVFASGEEVLTTLTETEVRRLYALAQGRASDISVPDEEEESVYSERYAENLTSPKTETVERYFTIGGIAGKAENASDDDAFVSFGIFSPDRGSAGSVRDECEKISEFICRDARRYDGELTF